jgi:hypothetical protein
MNNPCVSFSILEKKIFTRILYLTPITVIDFIICYLFIAQKLFKHKHMNLSSFSNLSQLSK